MKELFEIKELCVNYGKKEALTSVSAKIMPGQITAIIGPSGCGKTTLLKCLNGMIKNEQAAVSGQIFLDGQDISGINDEELRRKVGMVFQTPAPFPFSIYKNMTYALKYYGMRDKKELEKNVRDKLLLSGLYDEVKDDMNKSALKLSGGQQQRLCIARALSVEPEVLLLDEPCSALDVKSSAVIEEMLTAMKKQYTPVIVTHNIPQARRIADRIIFMHEGSIIEQGEAASFFEAPAEELTKHFLQGVFG